eukprot:1904505-Amphidinium_carterae.1
MDHLRSLFKDALRGSLYSTHTHTRLCYNFVAPPGPCAAIGSVTVEFSLPPFRSCLAVSAFFASLNYPV